MYLIRLVYLSNLINLLSYMSFLFNIQWSTKPGWDEICYFVGANNFSQKFRLKQRESDVTEDVQNSGNLGISSCDKKFLTVA